MASIKLPEQPQKLIDRFKENGYECFAVGGCVRDLLMRRPVYNWDFTTNATPEQIQALYPNTSYYENAFGTVGIKIAHNEVEDIYEVTTYRSESGYHDNRHPTNVMWGTKLTEDLKRRDFTVNAIATDGTETQDPHYGQKDLENKVIRAVGDAKIRFEEDALRLMRAVRIATQLEFTIEEVTLDAIKKSAHLITTIAAERVKDELFKILSSEKPAEGILMLKETGLLFEILPEFKKAFETDQKSPQRHHIYDVGTHLVESLRNCPSKDPVVRLATLLHDIGKPETVSKTEEGVTTFYNHEINGTTIARDICLRLKLSKKDTGRIIRLVRWHQFSVDDKQTDKALRRFITNVGKENLQDIMDLRTGDRLGSGATITSWRTELFKKRLDEVQKQPFSIPDLKVDGKDVMEILKIQPGPKVGEILSRLFEDVTENALPNEREILLKKIGDYSV